LFGQAISVNFDFGPRSPMYEYILDILYNINRIQNDDQFIGHQLKNVLAAYLNFNKKIKPKF